MESLRDSLEFGPAIQLNCYSALAASDSQANVAVGSDVQFQGIVPQRHGRMEGMDGQRGFKGVGGPRVRSGQGSRLGVAFGLEIVERNGEVDEIGRASCRERV